MSEVETPDAVMAAISFCKTSSLSLRLWPDEPKSDAAGEQKILKKKNDTLKIHDDQVYMRQTVLMCGLRKLGATTYTGTRAGPRRGAMCACGGTGQKAQDTAKKYAGERRRTNEMNGASMTSQGMSRGDGR